MPDERFCESLAKEISKALTGSTDERVRHFWCDGVLPPLFESEYSKKIVNDTRQIAMTAFTGPSGQDRYELILRFGPKALSRYARGLNIVVCIPDPENNEWLEIDPERRIISILLD